MILPYYCLLCLETSDQARDLCRHCQATLPISLHTCPQCGIVVNPITHPNRCGQCIKQTPYFDDTFVGFNYQTPIDHWLKQFKFHKKGLYARILTEIFAEKLRHYLESHPKNKPQLLIAMPLHWRRLTQRGFNQAYIITKKLSQILKIPIAKSTYVTRKKYTKPQSGLKRSARRRNMHNAFKIQRLPTLKHVVIIDDVVTTGNTANELAKRLKDYGIQRVSIWTLTRAN